MDTAAITALILALGGFIGGVGSFIVAYSTRKKYSAEAEHLLTEAAVTLIKPLRDEIESLHRQLNLTEARLRMFEQGVNLLIEQLKSLGIQPVWMPPDEDKDERTNIKPSARIRKGKTGI